MGPGQRLEVAFERGPGTVRLRGPAAGVTAQGRAGEHCWPSRLAWGLFRGRGPLDVGLGIPPLLAWRGGRRLRNRQRTWFSAPPQRCPLVPPHTAVQTVKGVRMTRHFSPR